MASPPPSRPPALILPPPPTPTTIALTAEPPSPSTIAASTASTVRTSTSKVGNVTSKVGRDVTAGATKMVGWTYENAKLETATQARGLRPMHVRVSVRVHHVAFLHPGLDNGGRATIGDRSGNKWKHFNKNKNKVTPPPGLLQFGNKKGAWKNPMSPKTRHSFGFKDDTNGGKLSAATAKLRQNLENEDAMEASEISDIISAEAFRLSRDGIIQHHYALNHASPQPPPPQPPPTNQQRSSTTSSSMYPASSSRRLGNKPNNNPSSAAAAAPHQSNFHPSILSPYSSANPQEAARYYKECAARPKGYRRLVVSSAAPTSDVPIPPPPSPANHMMTYASSRSAAASGGESSMMKVSKRGPRKLDKDFGRASTGTWAFEEKDSSKADAEEKDRKKKDDKNENLFNNVEYQYIGPPQTGPEFFQLLRAHGAATFGRYLPELACSVPNHSIGFELRKPNSKRRYASTQPLVAEAPHIVWGDARDKMLSRIAKEGCPLIDSRKFEYKTNAALEETELSESLMVCGATLWVQNADEEGPNSPKSAMKPKYTKGMVKAEYYGGKMVDGIQEGLHVGVTGLTRGTRGTINAAEKGTKKAFHAVGKGTDAMKKGTKEAVHAVEKGGKKLLTIPQDSELASASTTQAQSEEERAVPRVRKRDKMKSMFNPKKVGNKLRRRSTRGSRRKDDDGMSVDGSITSSVVEDDDFSVGGVSVATQSGHDLGSMKEDGADKDFDANDDEGEAVKTPMDELEEEFEVVQPVPYVLLLDDIIDIRIVSFPDKNEVIANFPISVASVMVQRSIDDRTSDPLKPSELTATLIQEPSAQLLRWGVELKVTLRAVEVKPHIPRVVPRPKDVIDEEMNKIKEKLKLLGKKPEEIKKDLQEKEDENVKEENDLNEAIVAFGYGKGENEGAGQSEVKLRQMFYCDREHGAIKRKMKRRTMLSDDEKKMMNDAMIDPSSLNRDYDKEDQQKLLELLDLAFPGIEKEDTATGSERASLNTRSTASAKSDIHTANDTLAKTSLAMAQSLDNCLGGLTDKPTVPVVQQRLLRHTITEGVRPHVTRSVAKEWCSDVADKLSNASTTDATIKSSIAKLQSIIAESALGSSMDVEEGEIDTNEESKLDEDEIALSQAKRSDSESVDLDSSKLQDWITAVASQLEAYAEELDDSETLDYIAQEDEEKTASSFGESLEGASTSPPSPGFGGGIGGGSGMMYDQQSPKESLLESRGMIDPDGVSPTKSLSNSTQIGPDPDEVMWEKVLSQKESAKSLCNSTQRFRSATSISTVKNALPRSQTKHNKSQTEPLLKGMKKSHGHSHQVNMRTSSLSMTVMYLSLIAAVFALGAFAAFKFYQELWSMMTHETIDAGNDLIALVNDDAGNDLM